MSPNKTIRFLAISGFLILSSACDKGPQTGEPTPNHKAVEAKSASAAETTAEATKPAASDGAKTYGAGVESIEQIVSYFRHAAQGLEERKQILYLLGPVGGGKSSLAEKLKALMQRMPFYALKGSPICWSWSARTRLNTPLPCLMCCKPSRS